MEKLHFFSFGRRSRGLLKQGLRVVLALTIASAIATLALLVWATSNASRYAQHYDVLLVLNAVFAVGLVGWVLVLFGSLARQIRRRQFGARLTARFALSFGLIGVLPGALIYVLSVQFMSRSIESWFNVRVDSALEAGLSLGRAALDTQLEDLSYRAQQMANQLRDVSDADMARAITRLRENSSVASAMVFSGGGRLVAFSSADYGQLIPDLPPPHVIKQLRLASSYGAAEADDRQGRQGAGNNDAAGFLLRVVLPVQVMGRSSSVLGLSSESRWLQVTEPVPEQIARNANFVQQGYRDYQELALARLGLRKLYGITLTMALVLAVFAAIVVALALSRRLVRPLLSLAAGTQAVSVGDYRALPEPPEKDEVGQLTRSFNAMTRQLDEARRMVENNRRQLERSNVYLESVLSNLSSGVLVFDEGFRVSLFNQGAQSILGVDLRSVKGRPLETVEGAFELAQRIREAFAAHTAVGSERVYWQQQFELGQEEGDGAQNTHSITLLARGTHLSIDGRGTGYLVVFDDISEVISANRVVAWGEVARRLAHEIKNPLTPIQLSAERLAMKLADRLDETDAAMLKRSTTTIVNQVASLKQMVDDFREYARTPPAQLESIDLNALIADVLTLYGWDAASKLVHDNGQTVKIEAELEAGLPAIEGDPTQLRQVIHNLLANARDAVLGHQVAGTEPCICVQTQLAQSAVDEQQVRQAIRFTVSDNGPGFDAQVLSRVFEPYITTKATGTGLGLAIVKKIIEEHSGRIDIANRRDGGARISILFTRLGQPDVVRGNTTHNDKAKDT